MVMPGAVSITSERKSSTNFSGTWQFSLSEFKDVAFLSNHFGLVCTSDPHKGGNVPSVPIGRV
jgi:hypothetical protein